MIKSITITNHLGETITLELAFPEKTGLAVISIEGLGPPTANVNLTDFSSKDGSLFNSARATNRNIVLTLKLLDKPTVEDVRQLTYKYFPIKKRIKFAITTDNRTCYTYGYIESNEPAIFSNNETAQISIVCPDAYFYKGGEESGIEFTGIQPWFEFPWSNESLTEPLLLMSERRKVMSDIIRYDGDAEPGVLVTIHALGSFGNVTVRNLTNRQAFTIDVSKIEELTGSPVSVGDDIIISSTPGSKYVRLLRSGVYYNILNALEKNAQWITLSKGNNVFLYQTTDGMENLQVRTTYREIFEGV